MAKKRRQHSKNGMLMRRILMQLQEFDLDEIKTLCKKYQDEENARITRKISRRKTAKIAKKKKTAIIAKKAKKTTQKSSKKAAARASKRITRKHTDTK